VTLLTWLPPDLPAIDRFYGTSLAERPPRVRSLWPPGLAPRRWPPPVLRRLFQYGFNAAARRLRHEFDLVIATEEESDLGGRGVQYIHFPRHGEGRGRLVGAYHRLAERLTGTVPARMGENVTVVNSDWVGALVRERHGGATVTIHPPAAGRFPDVPWEAREDGVVCVGRYSREKRFELLIDIVEAVRARGAKVHLHLVGRDHHPEYRRAIERLARGRAAWLFLEHDLSRDELARLLATHRWGLHGMQHEHFGMAVAEMVLAGMVPLVPDGGGQVEIVDHPRLRYRTRDEAVARFLALHDDAAACAAARAQLAARRARLGPDRFMAEIRALVAGLV
jgi:glycosyltransferase involved in cell wall biosynthesis